MVNEEKWKLNIETPFGIENCYLNISPDKEGRYCAEVSSEKGKIAFEPTELVNQKLFLFTTVEEPVQTKIEIHLDLGKNEVRGNLHFDYNASLKFSGTKV
jgi:hypothetical protein